MYIFLICFGYQTPKLVVCTDLLITTIFKWLSGCTGTDSLNGSFCNGQLGCGGRSATQNLCLLLLLPFIGIDCVGMCDICQHKSTVSSILEILKEQKTGILSFVQLCSVLVELTLGVVMQYDLGVDGIAVTLTISSHFLFEM